MNTIIVNPEYETLFSFKTAKQEHQFNAEMISLRILSVIEGVLKERGLRKADLAQMTGVSKSFITQLFNGDKMVNMHFLETIENALKIKLSFSLSAQKEKEQERPLWWWMIKREETTNAHLSGVRILFFV